MQDELRLSHAVKEVETGRGRGGGGPRTAVAYA